MEENTQQPADYNILAELEAHPDVTKELLYKHLGKADKVELFYDALKRFTQNGQLKYTFTFSWYAFFFTFWYFFYRKLYLPAVAFIGATLGLIFISTTLNIVVFVTDLSYNLYYDYDVPRAMLPILMCFINAILGIAVAIGAGAYAKYSYIKKFISDLRLAGFGQESPQEVLTNLRFLGGYNTWAIVVPIVLAVLSVLSTMMFIVLIIMSNMRYYW